MMPLPDRRLFELPGASTPRYRAMEGLRAYAALLIFCVHFFDAYGRMMWALDFNTFQLDQSPSVAATLAYYLFASHYGVDLFFLLSGFLICRMVRKDGFKYGTFLRHRTMRIYPAFLLSLGIWAWVRIGIQKWYGLEFGQLVGNLLFLNAAPALDVTPYNTVTWSLFYEFLFYLTFPFILLVPGVRSRFGPGIILAFGVGTVVALQALLASMFIRFAMFFAGALIACMDDQQLKRIANRLPVSLVLGVYLGATAFFASELGYARFIPLFVISASLLVVKVIFGSGLLHRFFACLPLRYLGNMSYSFYLAHGLGIEIVMSLADDLFSTFGTGMGLVMTMTTSFAVSLLISAALFLLAERPYFTWRHGRISRTVSHEAITA